MRRGYQTVISFCFLAACGPVQGHPLSQEGASVIAMPDGVSFSIARDYVGLQQYRQKVARSRFLSAIEHLKMQGRLDYSQLQILMDAYDHAMELRLPQASTAFKQALDRLLEAEKIPSNLASHIDRLWQDTGVLAMAQKPIHHKATRWVAEYQKAKAFEQRWMIDTVALETAAALPNGYFVENEQDRVDAQLILDMQYRVNLDSQPVALKVPLANDPLRVELVFSDLIDVACDLERKNSHVLVVTGGQGLFPWKGILGIQQERENLLERSSVALALDPALNEHLEQQLGATSSMLLQESLLYVPHVQIFRRRLAQGFAFCSAKRLDFMFTYQEGEMAQVATLEADLVEIAWRGKIRSLLRSAHNRGYRTLVLGVSSLRMQGQSWEKMAQNWQEILGEKEFLGAFSSLVFVLDDAQGSSRPAFEARWGGRS